MAFVYPTSFQMRMELSGVGAGYTNIAADVRQQVPITFRYGIPGSSLTDRVASPGALTFALNNSEKNSASLLGYYAPGHANCRSGFALGINVQFRIVYSATTYYKFVGRLSHIEPVAGQYGSRLTLCVVYDWMDEASRGKLKRIATQENKRADEVLTTIVAAMVRAPVSTTFGTGRDTYVFSLDHSPEEGGGVMREFQRIAQSEVGNIYVKGDLTGGGRLCFESRTDRAAKNTNLATFDNSMFALTAARNRDDMISRLQVVTHPKRKDLVAVVLFTLRDGNNVSEDTAIVLGPGEIRKIVCPYTDPSDRNHRIGAVTSTVNVPVATTDYLFNAAADGGGANMTASLSVASAGIGATAAFLTLTNNHATDTGYVTFLQIRGLGIYDEQDIISEQTSTAAEDACGENVLTYDMPYQSDPQVGHGASLYFLALLEAQQTNVRSIAVRGNVSDAMMTQVLTREVGDRIGIAEAATGIATTTGFFIQSCEGVYSKGGILTMRWGLAPASSSQFWLLGTAGASELGQTTNLAF